MDPVIPEGIAPPEALIACIGIEPFLEGKLRVTDTTRRRAAGLEHEIDRLILDAMRSEPTRVPEIAFNAKAVDKLLSESGNRDQARGFANAFLGAPPELAAGVQAAAGRIIRYLDERFPRRTTSGIVAQPTEPGAVELARFKRLWQVANDPLSVIAALGQGNLSRDMVRAVEDLYPAVYAAMRMAAVKAISRIRARRAKWEPTRAQDLQLRVLMQANKITPQLAAEIASLPTPPPVSERAAAPKSSRDGGLQTQGQRIAGR